MEELESPKEQDRDGPGCLHGRGTGGRICGGKSRKFWEFLGVRTVEKVRRRGGWEREERAWGPGQAGGVQAG